MGELTPTLQAKLLRAIELGEVSVLGSNDPPLQVDVRVIAATNRPLEQMRAEGAFRDDLFFRIAVVTIALPPLRSYLRHLEVLCQVFVAQANQSYDRRVTGVDAEALARLREHDFPGNMRELRNLIEHGVLVAQGPMIQAADLPLGKRSQPPQPPVAQPTLSALRKQWVAERERPHLARVLEQTDGDVRRGTAARRGPDDPLPATEEAPDHPGQAGPAVGSWVRILPIPGKALTGLFSAMHAWSGQIAGAQGPRAQSYLHCHRRVAPPHAWVGKPYPTAGYASIACILSGRGYHLIGCSREAAISD